MVVKHKVSVIGGGSFGTALAQLLADKGEDVSLWIRNKNEREKIAASMENEKYLQGIKLSKTLVFPSSMKEAIENSDFIVMAVPSASFRSCLSEIKSYGLEFNNKIFINVAKGIEIETLSLLSQVAKEEIPDIRFGVISGPSHAEEVARRIPTTVVASSEDTQVAKEIQNLFFTDRFRVYINSDIIGVQLAGALKNIIALAAGICDGLGYGDNGRAALITRGLAEIVRLGVAMGADRETFLGLTGVGDLIVTCTSEHSRNKRCGYMIGSGYSTEESVSKIGMVVEGIFAIKAAYKLSEKLSIDMPITENLYKVIEDELKADEAVDILMGREKKHE